MEIDIFGRFGGEYVEMIVVVGNGEGVVVVFMIILKVV